MMGRPEVNPVKVGDLFGSLTVVSLNFDFKLTANGYKNKRHLCRCDCGNSIAVKATSLKTLNTTSCGCKGSRQTMAVRARTHGHTAGGKWTPEYKCWVKIIERCCSPGDKAYPKYGGSGILICDEWRHSFESFYEHIGPKPSRRHSIDRIDNLKGYEPGNVRWATSQQQNRNRRDNRILTYQGESRCVREWEDVLGFKKGVLGTRLYLGWTGEKLFQPQVKRFTRKVAA